MKYKILFILLLFANFTFAQTVIFVKENGTGDGLLSWENATDLETAMILVETHNCASVQCQIWVQSGIYYPSATVRVPANVQMFGGFAGDEEFLHQRSFAKNRTIIDGQKSFTVVHLEAGAVLDGFAIINGHSHKRIEPDTLPFGGGVWMQENTRVENCYILDNSASEWGGGIFAEGDGLVYNVLFSGNAAGLEGLAIYGTTLEVRNVTVSQNHREGDTVTVDGDFCNIRTPAWVILGTQSFGSDSVWLTDTLLWSDAVSVTTCQKPRFDGGQIGPPTFFHSDCRSNPGQKGDLFSWCAVNKFGNFLCPAPWRVPTQQDFVNLDLALGGNGENRSPDLLTLAKYIGSQWGGACGGYFWPEAWHEVVGQYESARYWSSSFIADHPDCGGNLCFTCSGETHGSIFPKCANYKHFGNALRCVRDCPRIIINTHPDTTSRNVLEDDTFPQLFVSATSNIPLTYQWFSNTQSDTVGGTLIVSANSSNFTPPNNTPLYEVHFYYCVISSECRDVISEVSGAHIVIPPTDSSGCIIGAPRWGNTLGTVGFATNTTWMIGDQIWSDAVQTTVCSGKTSFLGATNLESMLERLFMSSDCRSNPEYLGDLFSWCAVARFADTLCPYPWRVPTTEDFRNLDVVLGGNGVNRYRQTVNDHSWQTQLNWYTHTWGGANGGGCNVNGIIAWWPGQIGGYWSLTELNDLQGNSSHMLFFASDGTINPQDDEFKFFGFSLRCVRDTMPPRCNNAVPGWGESLGEVSFATDAIWVVSNQVWSDAVTATNCQKTNFDAGADLPNGSINESINADCRSNPEYPGNLFSWCAVMRFQNQLCPNNWRVPTAEEFFNLNIALGGNGSETYSIVIRDRYINLWGGTYNGYSSPMGALAYPNNGGWYWSQTEVSEQFVISTSFHLLGYVYPQGPVGKSSGIALRCVRDTVIPPVLDIPSCNNTATPSWGTSLGTVTRGGERIISGNGITQIWSDAVTATACQKTTFNGGVFGANNYNSDCRSNPNYPGDLFSWCAVARFQHQLCPHPWRAPTNEDFRDLDIAMGGTGNNRNNVNQLIWYVGTGTNQWGGAWSGYGNPDGALWGQGSWGPYWSQSTSITSVSLGARLSLGMDGRIYPQFRGDKNSGKALRCVRNP